jgi:conjugative transfer signal peptidase TraF
MTGRHYLTVTALAAMGVAVAAFVPSPNKLIWNASVSAPMGFYTIEVAERIAVPELVAVMPPERLATFIVERGYVGRGVPLLKRVLGLPGQEVCRTGRTITVDTVEMGEALERDSLGRELPVWQGCRVVGDDQLFLMNWEVRDSLDGRYFGPIPANSVIGRALPLWTDSEGDGRYEWRTPTH